MLCSKLHCQKTLRSKVSSYQILKYMKYTVYEGFYMKILSILKFETVDPKVETAWQARI